MPRTFTFTPSIQSDYNRDLYLFQAGVTTWQDWSLEAVTKPRILSTELPRPACCWARWAKWAALHRWPPEALWCDIASGAESPPPGPPHTPWKKEEQKKPRCNQVYQNKLLNQPLRSPNTLCTFDRRSRVPPECSPAFPSLAGRQTSPDMVRVLQTKNKTSRVHINLCICLFTF